MLKISSLSDTGLVRSTNEDFYLFSREHRIIIVADGVGGYDYGEVASRLAAESAYSLLDNEFDEDDQIETDEPIKLLNKAVVFANKKVIDMKVQRPSHQHMGTTLTCLYLDNEFVYFSYIGDSRVYHIDLDDQTISQLTTDHTFSKNKLDSTKFPNLHARANHVLTRMVGAGNSVNPGFGKQSLKQGDIILACTDGLSDLISDEQILECVLQNKTDMNTCLKFLLKEVEQEGARDNITVVMTSSD